jgi:long-subunit fatty acid transport protein
MLKRTRQPIYIDIFFIILLFLFPVKTKAAYNEQMAIDPVSIALANTVTARPPGMASVHFNPAGLSKLPDGKLKASGFAHARLYKTLSTKEDDAFIGFMNTFGNPDVDDYGPFGWEPENKTKGYYTDPLDGQSEHNTSTDLFIPVVGRLHFIAAPTSAQSYRKPGSRWTFARAVAIPFSGGMSNTSPNPGDPNQFNSEHLHFYRINYLSPGVSYRVSDTFSIGLTAAAGMTLFGLERQVRSTSHMTALTRVLGDATRDLEIPVISEQTLPPPWFGGGIHPFRPVAKLEVEMQDYFSPSYNIGILWEPAKRFSFGAVYQSSIKNELTGKYKFTYTSQWKRFIDWNDASPMLITRSAMFDLPMTVVPYQSGSVQMLDFQYPQRIQAGIMVSPIKRVRLLCDIHWANWSVWSAQHLHFDQDLQPLEVAKFSGHLYGDRDVVNTTGLKDTFHWSYATEIDIKPNVTLRMGYEFRETSTPHEWFSASSMPDLDKYGIGLGFKFKSGTTLDLAYGYVTGDYYIPNDTSKNMNSLAFTKSSTSPYAGLDVHVDYKIHLFNFSATRPVKTDVEKAIRQKEKFKSLKRHLRYMVKKIKNIDLKGKIKKLNPFK